MTGQVDRIQRHLDRVLERSTIDNNLAGGGQNTSTDQGGEILPRSRYLLSTKDLQVTEGRPESRSIGNTSAPCTLQTNKQLNGGIISTATRLHSQDPSKTTPCKTSQSKNFFNSFF